MSSIHQADTMNPIAEGGVVRLRAMQNGLLPRRLHVRLPSRCVDPLSEALRCRDSAVRTATRATGAAVDAGANRRIPTRQEGWAHARPTDVTRCRRSKRHVLLLLSFEPSLLGALNANVTRGFRADIGAGQAFMATRCALPSFPSKAFTGVVIGVTSGVFTSIEKRTAEAGRAGES
eukprot:6204003-Pleurochrysis_carterae.AAC.5